MPRSKSRKSRSSIERGTIDFAVRSSKQSQATQLSETSNQKTSSLLDLPPEVLNIVLSYVIEIPWHPSNATFADEAIEKLFPPSALHINRSLRERSLDLIARDCLWIRIDFLSKPVWKACDKALDTRVPNVPPIYRKLLPPDLSSVRFTLGDPATLSQQTRDFKTQTEFIVFPFNYQSFAAFYGAMITMHEQLPLVRIELSSLSARMRRIVDVQVLSTVQLLRAYINVSVIEPTGQITISGTDTALMSNIPKRIDLLMSMVLALDAEKRVLEGSILCMYCGHALWWLACQTGTISHPIEWHSSAGPLAAPGWLQNPDNLEQMRLVRTLFYIELRAFEAYIEGTYRYGNAFAFIHHEDVTRLSTGRDTRYRWVDPPTGYWSGLPDHEAAAMLHIRASMTMHNVDFLAFFSEYGPNNQHIHDLHLGDRSDPFYALYYALRAWNMDMKNIQYASTLHNVARSDRKLVYRIQDHLNEEDSWMPKYLINDTQGEQFRDRPDYDSRLKQLSWSVEVAYDKRQEADLPPRKFGDRDLKMVRRLFQCDYPKTYMPPGWVAPTWMYCLDWKIVGLNEGEFFEPGKTRKYEFGPWSSWTSM